MTVGMLAGPASAGEITGNGKSTPIRDHVAASICAFSGLDEPGDEGDPFFGRTQNFGQLVKQGIVLPAQFNPGDACNPSGHTP